MLPDTTTSTGEFTPSQDDQRPAFALIEGYMVASVLAGLEMAGLLERLEADGLDEQADEARDAEPSSLLQAAFCYLLQRGVLTRRDGRLKLSPFGLQACADKGYLVWLNGGYGAPLRELDAFFEGRSRYGQGSVRDGRWVAIGSALLGARDVAPEAMTLLEGLAFRKVLDLGCGNGRFLISVCDRFGCDGVGIDISPEACEEARQAAIIAGHEKRVRFELGDAASLEAAPLERTELVIAFFLLHEIYSIGRGTLVKLLREMAERMPPGAHLLAAEVEPAPQQPLKGALFTPEFTFMHKLMRQTLIPEPTWREVLAEGGFEVAKVIRPRMPGGLLLLAQPA
jgi:SAM-dependent methyltransferase